MDNNNLQNEDDYKPFIWAIIRRNKLDQWVKNIPAIDEDDLYQEGWILLQESRSNFESVEGYEFVIYAWSFVSTRLMNYIDSEARKAKHENYQYQEGMADSKTRVPSRLDEIKRKFDGFDKLDLQVIDYIGHNCTQREIGDKLGISHQAVSKRLQKIKTEVAK